MRPETNILLIDGSFFSRAGIEKLINELPGLKLIAVMNGNEKHLEEKIIEQKPDIVILNPSSLNTNLVHFCNNLNEYDIGLVGLIKGDEPENIKSRFSHILHLTKGKSDLLEVMKQLAGEHRIDTGSHESMSGLSPREETILKEVALGQTTQEIADKLYLSVHTVTTHRKNISRKLGIKTASGLTVYALMNKLIEIEEIGNKAQ